MGPTGRAWARLGPEGRPEWGAEGASLREAQGWLWACPGEAPAGLRPPEVPGLQDPSMAWRWGSVSGPAEVQDHVENTLDLLHPPHVHPFTHPMAWARRLGFRRPLRVRAWPTEEGFQATAWLRLAGRERRLFEQRVVFPGAVGLELLPGSPWPSQVWAFHDPLGPRESRLSFLVGQAQPLGLKGGAPKEDRGGWRLHHEDLALLEGLARARVLWGDFPERLVGPDAYVQLYRRGLAHLQSWGHLGAWAEGAPLDLVLPP